MSITSSVISLLWLYCRALHHYRDNEKPLQKHPELERLLKEEYRSLEDFRATEKADKAAAKEFVASSSGGSNIISSAIQGCHQPTILAP